MIDLIKEYWGIIVAVVGFFFGWVKFTATKTYATKKELENTNKRISDVEKKCDGLATQNDIHDLKIELTKVSGSVEKIEAISSRMERTVQRQEEFLMNGGHK